MTESLWRWRVTARALGVRLVLVACLLASCIVCGCQKGTEQTAEVGHTHGAEGETEAATGGAEPAPEAAAEQPAPAAPTELPTLTIAQFRERVKQTRGGSERSELLMNATRVVKDYAGLGRLLIEILRTDADEEVRATAARQLGTDVGVAIANETVSALVSAMDPAKEPDSSVRSAAATALMDYAAPPARQALLRAIEDPVPEVAHQAARSMAVSLAQEGPSGWVHLAQMLGRPEADASALASLEFRREGLSRRAEVVNTLLAALQNSQRPRQRAAIAACLGMICSGNTPTQDRFAKADKGTTRVAREESTPYTAAVEPLIKALSDPSPEVREAAAQALGLIGDPRASKPLARALKDSSKYVRKRAASALMLLPPSPEAFAALSDAAVNDPYPEARRYAVEALGWSGEPAAVDTLIQAMSDKESAEVRATAARYLGRLGDKKAVPALVERFADEDVDVRWAATRSVGQLGGTQAESALRELILSGKQEAQVVQAARESLRRMGRAVPLSAEAKRLFERKPSGTGISGT